MKQLCLFTGTPYCRLPYILEFNSYTIQVDKLYPDSDVISGMVLNGLWRIYLNTKTKESSYCEDDLFKTEVPA